MDMEYPRKTARVVAGAIVLGWVVSGCTGQVPGVFRFAQQTQTFKSTIQVNTKIDMLWVVDNSASMDVEQQKLRAGFATFAQTYLKPNWDMRLAAITTDTYMANPAFSPYLNTVVPGSVGYSSNYIKNRAVPFVNPSWNATLVDPATGIFTNGVKYGELVPVWGPNYAKLLPGLHDGPVTGLCFEGLPYFLRGLTQCSIRDNPVLYPSADNCVTPNTGAGETSESQCVNTVENDIVRSGNAVISTTPPPGTPGDAAWVNKLVHDFTLNMSTGTVGSGSERGLGSVLQLLSDNETTGTPFFRPDSLRVIIFISDEDDQTAVLPNPAPAGFNPFTHYMCDQASLLAANPGNAGAITGVNGMCCNTPGNNCTYGAEGTSCPQKIVGNLTYTTSICPIASNLVAVSNVKTQLDNFFLTLDGQGATDPNYFVTSIVALTDASIQSLQADRDVQDAAVGAPKSWAVDRADRYIQLGNLVGNGSMSMDIASVDYTPILTAVGQAIVQKKGTFTLARAPTSYEEMTVAIIHADQTVTVLTSAQFTINGKVITIIDLNLVLSLTSTDVVSINYQPKTAF